MTNKMPVLFVGHGSPMNAIEDNSFTRNWEKIAAHISKPEAILSVSAHWYTRGSKIMDTASPRQIYDIYGFPEALYKLIYEPVGATLMAHRTKALVDKEIQIDNTWGIDHGTWSVLCKMYPKADIPVFQLSIDAHADAAAHFKIGQELAALREQGVLILGSGNVVHNLALINWDMEAKGYPWANEFDAYIKDKIVKREYADVINYRNAGSSSTSAFVTPDHFYPLLYVLGASKQEDKLTVFNDACVLGSLSMTCYLFA